MDSGTIIVAAVFTAICILPFFLTGRKYRKLKRRLSENMSGLAAQKNCRITVQDVAGNFGIGMDEKSEMLFFARLVGDNIVAMEVALAGINKCRLNNVAKVFDEGEKVIERIELVLYTHPAGGQPIVLGMYNMENDSSTLSGELQVAEKWAELIEKVLLKHKSKARASSKKAAVA